MKIKFIEKENDQMNNCERIWFDVDGKEYGVVRQFDEDGTCALIDSEGNEITDNDRLTAALVAEVFIAGY